MNIMIIIPLPIPGRTLDINTKAQNGYACTGDRYLPH